MGKPNSCFKIITCGNDSADKDDLDVSERKGSSDKRGWSFRKRSAQHRVLSNTVIAETPTSGNKESPESAPLAFQSPASTTVPEKVSIIQCTDEKPQLLTLENPRVSVTENISGDQSKVDDKLEDENKVEEKLEAESKGDVKLDESAAVFVQTAVRGSLAQKSLVDLKNVVKLQAAVRGHLVRRHAVGTLRCVQAIVKMQALVRARQSLQKDNHMSTTRKKANATYISIEKLLSNSFAHQLLESTPKNQPIHVKCDPSKPDSDSAWKWLEMWMSVSTKDTPHLNEAISVVEQQEKEKEEITESPLESKIQFCEMEESNSSIKESTALSESEESLITYDADNFNFQSSDSTSFTVRHNNEQPQFENASTSAVKESAVEINLSEADSYMEFKALSEKPVIETEQPKRSMKRSATDQLETDGKKSVYGSRKVTNPAFIAAQSKFAELTSTTNSARSISPSLEDASGVESQRDTFSSEVDSELRAKELSVADNPVIPHGSQVQVGGSDCGTEISISSTLDSPDISDVGATEREHEHHVKVSEERVCSPNNVMNIDDDTEDSPVSNSCNGVAEPEIINVVNDETITSKAAMIPPQTESKPERTTSDVQREQETSASMQAYGSSPEASPRSHLTVPESQQGTPSSLISVKAKRSKGEKSGSNKKRMSLSAGKKSPSNPNHDSASSKDHKSGKRRNSFGSTKPDQADQEPRDSSSSSSIPHFMQATESARAKLQATTSPRSSPDVQDREIYIKKRHSLPGVNGRQGSPRIQRSVSQAQTQQGAKGTERKWQR